MTYGNQMTGKIGHLRQGGFELWDVFFKQTITRFGPTHDEKALRKMLKVRYKHDINQFHLEFDNWNVEAEVTGIAFRKLIRD